MNGNLQDEMERKVKIRNKRTGEMREVVMGELGNYGLSLPGAQPAAMPSGSGDTTGMALELIKKHFPKDQWQNAYQVMLGESGGNSGAIGDNYPIQGEVRPSYGLFQIRTFPNRPAPEDLLNPEENVAYAAKLWKAQGWKPWTAARKLGIS